MWIVLAGILVSFLAFAAYLAAAMGAGMVRAEQDRYDRDLMYALPSDEHEIAALQTNSECARQPKLTAAFAHR
jgi:hypothetical protein